MADYDRVGIKSEINTSLCRGRDPAETVSQALGEIVQNPPAPTGIMVWWTGTAASVPSGWALMDGSDNSVSRGGSGLNLVGRFVLAAATGAGTTGGSSRTSRDGHSHTALISNEDVPVGGLVGQKTTGLTQTGQAAYPEHSVTVTGGEGTTPSGGAHTHEADTDEVTVVLDPDGTHDHGVTTTSNVTLAAHTAEEVVGLISNHSDHTHGITVTTVSGAGGSQDNKFVNNATGSVTDVSDLAHTAGGGTLAHDQHTHTVTLGDSTASTHTHPTVPHGHEIVFVEDGEHKHTVESHSHPVTYAEEAAHHTHPISEAPHTHPLLIDASGHSHGGVAHLSGGGHDHESGSPAHMQLLPIEKLSRVVLA